MRLSLALLTALASSSIALQVLPNSPCAVQCGNDLGGTSGADIACLDTSYGITPGQTFQTCVGCQLSSTYVDPTTQQTDLQSALYNMRYAISWCIFGYPNNTQVGSSPCETGFACGQLQSAFEFDSLAPEQGEFAYCSQYASYLVPRCTNCTAQVQSQMYLTNYAVFLNAACQQQPVPGKTVSIAGNVFSSNLIVITNPSSQAVGTFTPSTGGLNLGDKIGIAVGGILAILGVTGFCVVWNGRRRRRRVLARHQKQTGYADWLAQQEAEAARGNGGGMVDQTPVDTGSAGGFFDSPQSTRPLVRAWMPGQREEESPMSAVGEKAYFSPYSSNYSSPQSAGEQALNYWPLDRKGSIPGTGRSRSVEREEPGDRIEMQNVPPVLHHPGHGRGKGAPYLPGLSEEDVKRGTAL